MQAIPQFATARTKNLRRSIGGLGLALFLCLGPVCHLAAETITGKIITVKDGDTVVMMDESNRQHTLRLAGIDAPEKKQAFGQRSKQNLADMVFGKMSTAEVIKIDKYGRSIAVILVEGKDINLEQVRVGLAWHYKEFQVEQSAKDRAAYAEAEDEARSGQLGIWADKDPMPPWAWRHRKRNER